MYKKLFITLGIFFFLCLIIISLFLFSLFRGYKFAGTPKTYILMPGTPTIKVAYDLKRLDVLRHPRVFTFTVKLEGHLKQLKSGEYQFQSGVSLQDIINKLIAGDVVKHQITIVDGWTFKQMMNAFDNDPYLTHVLNTLTPAQIAMVLKLDQADPEGLFLPETYQFTWPDSDQKILLRAHKLLQLALHTQWPLRTTGDVYKAPYEALIAASLIQKEGTLTDDRAKISGVIYRRLQQKMLLQIDPTVIYALGDRYQGKLHHKDLRINSPYNTYRNRGLPPTPIAMVGVPALYAALHPASGTELYFVAKGDGSHFFSTTLPQHDQAIKQFLLK
ncbi:MAG: endolytic transglycosylase MltG [Gammaproteobacteria bacterium]|nr:endolytic transglycosylase MltG [Gammaproteobacteria bacterium]